MKSIGRFIKNPKKLFLIDGLGALISAFLLGVVLVQFQSYIGIPVSVLYLLAALPIFFALFDVYAYRKPLDRMGSLLKKIAIINILYCSLSLGLTFFHFKEVTILGWTYILVEIIIVIGLSFIELKVAKGLKPNKS